MTGDLNLDQISGVNYIISNVMKNPAGAHLIVCEDLHISERMLEMVKILLFKKCNRSRLSKLNSKLNGYDVRSFTPELIKLGSGGRIYSLSYDYMPRGISFDSMYLDDISVCHHNQIVEYMSLLKKGSKVFGYTPQ